MLINNFFIMLLFEPLKVTKGHFFFDLSDLFMFLLTTFYITFIKNYEPRAVEGKSFLEPNASSIPVTYFRLG